MSWRTPLLQLMVVMVRLLPLLYLGSVMLKIRIIRGMLDNLGTFGVLRIIRDSLRGWMIILGVTSQRVSIRINSIPSTITSL